MSSEHLQASPFVQAEYNFLEIEIFTLKKGILVENHENNSSIELFPPVQNVVSTLDIIFDSLERL